MELRKPRMKGARNRDRTKRVRSRIPRVNPSFSKYLWIWWVLLLNLSPNRILGVSFGRSPGRATHMDSSTTSQKATQSLKLRPWQVACCSATENPLLAFKMLESLLTEMKSSSISLAQKISVLSRRRHSLNLLWSKTIQCVSSGSKILKQKETMEAKTIFGK